MGLLQDVFHDNHIDPAIIAERLRTTKEDIAVSAGLGRDSVLRRTRMTSMATQRRLREMIEIINLVTPRFGNSVMAYAWYRSAPLAGFSGSTAMQLTREGRAAEILDYIEAVDAGVYA